MLVIKSLSFVSIRVGVVFSGVDRWLQLGICIYCLGRVCLDIRYWGFLGGCLEFELGVGV